MAKKKAPKPWKDIQKNLLSKEDKIFNAAIKDLEKNGHESFLKPFVSLINSMDDKRKVASFGFLAKLKQKGAEKFMMDIIKDNNNQENKDMLLNCMWNSSLDYTSFFSDFVEIACDGKYITALECLTILENLNGPFNEKQVLEAQLHLKNYLENKKNNDEKEPLISEIALFIKKINEQLSDFDQEFIEL